MRNEKHLKNSLPKMCERCDRRPRAHNRRICYACKSRDWTEKNPERRVWLDLRSSAKKRGIGFRVTFPQFERFLERNPDYMQKRGRGSTDLTIDRPREGKAYTEKNMQVLEKHLNVKKYFKFYRDKANAHYDKLMADLPF